MTYQVTFCVPVAGTFVEIEVSAAPEARVRVCLAVDNKPAGEAVHLYPEEARRIAAALCRAAGEQEPK